MPSHRSNSSFAQPPDGAFQLEDDEDEEAEFASPAATLSPGLYSGTSPFAGASASPASSAGGDDAESRWVCSALVCCNCRLAGCAHRKPSVMPHTRASAQLHCGRLPRLLRRPHVCHEAQSSLSAVSLTHATPHFAAASCRMLSRVNTKPELLQSNACHERLRALLPVALHAHGSAASFAARCWRNQCQDRTEWPARSAKAPFHGLRHSTRSASLSGPTTTCVCSHMLVKRPAVFFERCLDLSAHKQCPFPVYPKPLQTRPHADNSSQRLVLF